MVLQGDKLPPDGSAGARPVNDATPFSLLKMIAGLNQGDTGEGKRLLLKTLPRLVPGVVGNPNRKDVAREFDLLERKAAAGARFVITQPVFEAAAAKAVYRAGAAKVWAGKVVPGDPAGQARIDGGLPERQY